MGRFLLTIAAGSLAVIGVAWWFGWTVPVDPNDPSTSPPPRTKLGDPLFKAVDDKPLVVGLRRYGEEVVLHDCYLNPLDKVEISSPRDGQLLFIGYEVPVPSWFSTWYADYYRKEFGLGIATFAQGDYEGHVAFQRLFDGDIVQEGQMVALINPDLALNDVEAKRAKLVAAHADYDASGALAREAEDRLQRLEIAMRRGEKVVPAEEYAGAKLTYAKYYLESISKKEGKRLAEIEVKQAEIVYRQHQIINKLPGVSRIKMTYKHAGEGIKQLEPILQLQNLSRLRAEGKIESQYFDTLRNRKGAKVVIEPTSEFPAHRLSPSQNAEITSIAICNEHLTHEQFTKASPRFVTASEGPRAAVWSSRTKTVLDTLGHKSAVRVVACTPAGASKNLCLTGCADGSIRIWDLDNLRPESASAATPLMGPLTDHSQAITALAFSPDGKFFASADQNNLIRLWSTETGKSLYPFDAEHHVDDPHQDQITSLHFTPQCQLISASRDLTVRTWNLHEGGATLAGQASNRTGHISQLGVSRDGRKMLFDRGRTLQIWSVKEQRSFWEIENHAARQFEPIALFSPDEEASLILTASGTEGRLQLWQAPTAKERGFEIRQFVPKERTTVTCGAFSPTAGSGDGAFAITGTKEGHVYFCELPKKSEIDLQRIAKDEQGRDLTLSLLEQAIEGNQVRVSVMLSNAGRLTPGQRVTLVIQPE